MNEQEVDLKKVPFAPWLESIMPTVCRQDARAIAIICINKDGTVGTGYYNANAGDKGTMAWQMLLDGVWDMITVNADRLKERLEEIDTEREQTGDDGAAY